MARTFNRNGEIQSTRLSFKGIAGVTKQSHRDGTRVDRILKRYATLGVDENNLTAFMASTAKLPFGIAPKNDYQDALNAVIRVESYFKKLPSKLREKFNHDPEVMVAYLADPKNLKEAQTLGLIAKPPETTPETPPAGSASPSTTTPPSSGKADPAKP